MSKLIPQDIEEFLYDLGTRRDGVPGAYEEYAKAAAALLWEKYVLLEDASIQILPGTSDRYSASSKPLLN
jgi:hypothetical protein